jgi:hypothetical protein
VIKKETLLSSSQGGSVKIHNCEIMNKTTSMIPPSGIFSKVVVNEQPSAVYATACDDPRDKKPKRGRSRKKRQRKEPLWKEHRDPYRRFIAKRGRIHASLLWECPMTALVKSERDRRLEVIKAISEEPRLDNPEKQLLEFMCKPGCDGVFWINKVMSSSLYIRLSDIESHEEFLVRMLYWTVRSVPRDSDAIVYCHDTEFVERLHMARRQRLRSEGYRDPSGHPIPNAHFYAELDDLIGDRRVSVRYPEPTYKNTNPYGRGFLRSNEQFFTPSPR